MSESSSTSDTGCCAPPNGSNKGENDSVCCGSQGTSTLPNNMQVKKEHLDIDFMYLDLSICTRCQGTESSLDEAITEVSKILEATGTQVNVQKIHVKSEVQAAELGFVVSPTIRVNGQDIQMNFRESRCESCGTLCDCEGEVSCREWEYQGQWYVVPPKGLIIEAILMEVYGGAKEEREVAHRTERVPDNLKRFFDSTHQK
ncbi:DUF2703 domain-containing protein [Photobacterium lipolyticum]|nr:DUF2703 domain-containing protein [Photobacterium lipolyticum]